MVATALFMWMLGLSASGIGDVAEEANLLFAMRKQGF